MKHIIKSVLDDLKAQDYREGFNDGVIYRVRDAIAREDQELARRFWSLACNFPNREAIIKEFMDDDESLYEYYLEVEEMSMGPGAFVMPSWGTYGT